MNGPMPQSGPRGPRKGRAMIDEKRMKELRGEAAKCASGWDSQFDAIEAWLDLIEILDAYAALKKENERLTNAPEGKEKKS